MRDYVEAMWLMLQHKEPDDFVVATGEAHSGARVCRADVWISGFGLEEVRGGRCTLLAADGSGSLAGRSEQGRKLLGWKPKVTFDELVRVMVDHDMELARQEQTLRRAGHVVAEGERSRQ